MASQPPQQYDPTWGHASPYQDRGSGCGKWFVGSLIGCGVVILLCCGGGVLFTYMGVNALSRSATEDPQEIRRIAADIAEVKVPEGLEPKAGMDAKIPFVNMTMIRFAVFGDKDDHEAMVLAEMPLAFESLDTVEFRRQIQQARDDKKGQGPEEDQIEIKEAKFYDREINGQKASFEIQKGVDKKNNRDVVQGVGVFKGKHGTAFLMVLLNGDEHTEDDVRAVIDSIDNPVGNADEAVAPDAPGEEPAKEDNPDAADKSDADEAPQP